MKTSTLALVALAIVGLTAPALAGKARSSSKKKPAAVEKMARPINYGEGFELSRPGRRSALPAETAPVVELAALTPVQVGQVVKQRLGDLEYCWDRTPTGERVAGTAVLKLSIEMTGAVAAIDVGGDVPTTACSCIEAAARRWTFPGNAIATDLEYPVSLK